MFMIPAKFSFNSLQLDIRHIYTKYSHIMLPLSCTLAVLLIGPSVSSNATADLHSRDPFTEQDLYDVYGRRAENYTGYVKSKAFRERRELSFLELAKEYLLYHWAREQQPSKPWEHMSVLDLGCGTGIMGPLLKDVGFGAIHGLDGSQEMVDEAKEIPAYELVWQEWLSENSSLGVDKYDVVIARGVFGFRHVPVGVLPAVVRALKPSGLLVISHWYYAGEPGTARREWFDGMDNALNSLSGTAVLHRALDFNYMPFKSERDQKTGLRMILVKTA